MEDLIGSKVVNQDGELDLSTVTAEVVGLYFSAHWCPPCRGFTPMLAEFYTNLRSKMGESAFEIIFVSSDSDDASFNQYFGEMPWLALPFEDRDKKNELSEKFGVQGIPTLVLLRADGTEITKEARSHVMQDPTGEKFPWAE